MRLSLDDGLPHPSLPQLAELLIELWRYLETGVVPEGAELKTDARVR